jgi:putative peptide zinc metalloprotease protein
MATKRPTFHESWYRIAELKPRLLSNVHVYRQHFRGQVWHVLENPSNNEFSRLSTPAYSFVALLDGHRTVSECWHICNEQLQDAAPTQGEVIQLLGQLYTSNLLYGDLPADTESLFNRYQARMQRKIRSYLANLLFIHIPLIDPDNFLNRWVNIVGRVFSRTGLAVWFAFLVTGLYYIISNFKELIYQSRDVLAPGNLFWLYLSFIIVKVLHEFSHAFACKRFGKLNGGGGQVHTMGVMFLVFVPMPYVDASSAWAFRNKWHRIVVGTAGMMAELLFASIAAIFWANTSTGTAHIVAYNIIFIASVSTLLFNGNPLLRYDAYYILSDLIEIPNLGERSKSYIYYLIRRYCWSLKYVTSPAHSSGECIWFVFYGIGSTAYRIFISIRILLFLNNRLPEELFIIVPALGLSAIVMWAFVPLFRFLRYLFTGPELSRNRTQAVWSTSGTLFSIILLLGILPLPYHIRLEGVVEPVELAIIHAEADGMVQNILNEVTPVTEHGQFVLNAINPELQTEKEMLEAETRAIETKWRLALTQEAAAAQVLKEQINATKQKLERIDYLLNSLNLSSPLTGTWIPSEIEKKQGLYVKRGQQLGMVGSTNNVRIRGIAGQAIAALLIKQPYKSVEIRVMKKPHKPIQAEIEKILPAGLEILPSQALGYAVGGSTPTQTGDERGIKAAENFFEVRLRPEKNPPVRLLSGQRVVARIELPPRPLAAQWWTSIRQLFQRRFRI